MQAECLRVSQSDELHGAALLCSWSYSTATSVGGTSVPVYCCLPGFPLGVGGFLPPAAACECILLEVFWIVGLFLLRKIFSLKIEEMKIFSTDKYLPALSKQPQKPWHPNITSCWIAYSLCSVHQWQLHVAVWMVCFSDSASWFVFVKQESFYFFCPISSTRWNSHAMAFKYNHCPCATSLLYGSSVIKRRGHTWSRRWQRHTVLISSFQCFSVEWWLKWSTCSIPYQ